MSAGRGPADPSAKNIWCDAKDHARPRKYLEQNIFSKRGVQVEFDVSGSRPPFKVPPREPPRTRRNFDDGRVREPQSHEVGVQIPCRVHSQVPPEDPLWRA